MQRVGQEGRQSDGYGGWGLELRRGGTEGEEDESGRIGFVE